MTAGGTPPGAAGTCPSRGPSLIGPGALWPSSGVRDLFPLPRPVGDGRVAHGRAQARRAEQTAAMVTCAVDALNWLAGRRAGGSSPIEFLGPSPMQDDVHQRIHGLVSDIMQRSVDSAARPDPREALSELLRGKALYGGIADSVLAPYRVGRPSLPEGSADAPFMMDHLSPQGLHYAEGQGRRMRRDEEEARKSLEDSPITPYGDPALMRSRKTYRDFVLDLRRRGLVDYGLTCKEMVSVFFVWKKGKERSRMILDCRRSNRWFLPPPRTPLLTAEGLSNFVLLTGEEEQAMDPNSFLDLLALMALHIGIADVKDCFHRILTPPWLRRFFALPPLRAEEVGVVGQALDDEVVGRGRLVYPLPCALPMGFSWALALCQDITEHRAATTPCLRGSLPLRDRGPPLEICLIQGNQKLLRGCLA